MTNPALMLVTDRRLVPPGTLPDAVDRAIRGGVGIVQMREYDLPPDEEVDLALALRDVTRDRAVFIVNPGHWELAYLADADGIHLKEGTPYPPSFAREEMSWSRSVHSVEAALAASDGPLSLLVMGTIFPSRSHPHGPTSGPDLIRATIQACESNPDCFLPDIFGIGGVTADNAGTVIKAGADGVAVISAILGAADPTNAAALISKSLFDAFAEVGREPPWHWEVE